MKSLFYTVESVSQLETGKMKPFILITHSTLVVSSLLFPFCILKIYEHICPSTNLLAPGTAEVKPISHVDTFWRPWFTSCVRDASYSN